MFYLKGICILELLHQSSSAARMIDIKFKVTQDVDYQETVDGRYQSTHISYGVCSQDILSHSNKILKPSVSRECLGNPFFLVNELRGDTFWRCTNKSILTGEPYGVHRSSWSVSWSQKRSPPERAPQKRREKRMTSQGWLTTNNPHLHHCTNLNFTLFHL